MPEFPTHMSRRGFVGTLAVGGLAIAGAKAFDIPSGTPRDVPGTSNSMESPPPVSSQQQTAAAVPTAAPDSSSHESHTTGTPEPDHDDHDPDETDNERMDRLHAEGVAAFPAETSGLGGQPLEYEMDGDVKVFRLTCEHVEWETEPGRIVEGWAYNGVVPGPEIRVTEGEMVRIIVTNELEESTAIHWHGLILPNAMDGVPFLTQPPIKPGETFTYEFRANPVGSHMYHSHHNAAKQVSLGLLGAFIVEPADPTTRPAFDREFTIILNDGPHGYTINGKGFPATQPVVCKKDEKVLIRYMNEGMMIHPMHLHGMPQTVIAKDGYLQPMPWMCDTLNIAPGERWDVIIDATEVGAWAFHCHILTHAESAHGMFGMVTVFIVEE
jgi:manganese oxidase